MLGLLQSLLQLGRPHLLLAWQAIWSVTSFTFMSYDKYQASNAGWRVREQLLHLFDALGGWPGGFAAQRLFKHKTRKTSFRVVFWITVVVWDALWLLLLWVGGWPFR